MDDVLKVRDSESQIHENLIVMMIVFCSIHADILAMKALKQLFSALDSSLPKAN